MCVRRASKIYRQRRLGLASDAVVHADTYPLTYGICTRRTRSAVTHHLDQLVCLVYLVCFVSLVEPDKPNQPDRRMAPLK